MPYVNINYPNHDERNTEFSLHWSGSEAGGNSQMAVAIPVEVLREILRLHDSTDGKGVPDEEMKLFFYSDQISRYELNAAIKALRRMRNAVYGGDE